MTVNLGSTFFFFQNQTTDFTSPTFILDPGHDNIVVKAWGTWGGANIILQTIAPGTAATTPVWIQVNDQNGNAFAFTSNSQQTVADILNYDSMRAVLSGSTGTTNLNLSVEYV